MGLEITGRETVDRETGREIGHREMDDIHTWRWKTGDRDTVRRETGDREPEDRETGRCEMGERKTGDKETGGEMGDGRWVGESH